VATLTVSDADEGTLTVLTMARPLLPLAKARLVATCDENQLQYVVDPSNANPKHQRNAVRKALAAVSATGTGTSTCTGTGTSTCTCTGLGTGTNTGPGTGTGTDTDLSTDADFSTDTDLSTDTNASTSNNHTGTDNGVWIGNNSNGHSNCLGRRRHSPGSGGGACGGVHKHVVVGVSQQRVDALVSRLADAANQANVAADALVAAAVVGDLRTGSSLEQTMRRGRSVELDLDVLQRAPPQQQAVALDKVISAVTVAKRVSTRLVQLLAVLDRIGAMDGSPATTVNAGGCHIRVARGRRRCGVKRVLVVTPHRPRRRPSTYPVT
jgi:hypothetical protein